MTFAAQGIKRIAAWLLAWLIGWVCVAPVLAEPTDDTVRMGFHVKIARDLSRAEVKAALSFWANELGSKFGVPTQVRFYDDMGALRRDFDSGQVNFVITSSMEFVHHFKIEELAEGFVGAIQVDHSLMLASRAESDIRSVENLAGKSIALFKDDELSEVYLETLCLRHYRRACKEVFAKMETADTSNTLAMRLFFGKVDVILTRKNGLELAKELNPQMGKAIRVVREFPVKSSYYGFFSRAVDPAFRTRALMHVQTMHENPRGRQVLEVFKLDRLKLASEDELQPFVRLLHDYESLRAEVGRKRAAR